MSSPTNVLAVYKELAECYEGRGQAQMRDRFLVLAADAALSAGQADEAERLRLRLLQANPHHMLKPYASFDQARAAPDVDTYVRNLRLNYPLQVAADLLRALHASDDPGKGQLQVTAPTPPTDLREEPTMALDTRDSRKTAGRWDADDDAAGGTLALPGATLPSEPTRPTPVARPRVPTKAEPAAPRAAAPRSTAPAVAPPTRPSAPTRPTAVPRSPTPKAPPRPTPGPSPFSAMSDAPSPRAAPAADEPDESAWMSAVLLVVVGLLGLGAAAFTLARPFLPKGWLP